MTASARERPPTRIQRRRNRQPLRPSNAASGDSFYGIQNVFGSDFNDVLYSDAKVNATFIGGKGADQFYGYGVSDTISYQASSKAVTIGLTDGTQVGTGDESGDYFSGVENAIGTDFNDKITGSTANNIIEGGKGTDTIDGGGGNDTVSFANAFAGVTRESL